MKSHRSWWIPFFAGIVAVCAAMIWVSTVVLRLEADARYQESLRLAMWRMDSWFAPRLAREAARPYFEYLPYYAQERAYTKILNEIEPGEVLTPSPLLTYRSEFLRIHFQLSNDGEITSPQVPTRSQRDLAETTLLSGSMIDGCQSVLELTRPSIDLHAIADRMASAENRLALLTYEPPPDLDLPQAPMAQGQSGMVQSQQRAQTMWTQQEQVKRAASSNYAQRADEPQTTQVLNAPDDVKSSKSKGGKSGMLPDEHDEEPEEVHVGPLIALWLPARAPQSDTGPDGIGAKPDFEDSSESIAIPVAASAPPLPPDPLRDAVESLRAISSTETGGELELFFIRRVQLGDREWFQGFVVDWPAVRGVLLQQIDDLFESPQLVPMADAASSDDPSGRVLATIPAMLQSPRLLSRSDGVIFTPARITLTLTWLAVATAILAAGITLRASIAYGEKRSRFASSVTHELRTPLTTFRMYSEMLAEGMVRDEQQRATYLQTLKSESGRLATLVENVLSYARLEEGRIASHRQSTTVREMIDRLLPILTRRATDTGMTLHLDLSEACSTSPVVIDIEMVGQILFNLVDNACKYAHDSADRTIELRLDIVDHVLSIIVRDHGPGVPADCARRIFNAFDRGRHDPGDTIPGVGLGLALSRGLARDMGGDLELVSPREAERSSGGAAFELTLPMGQA